MKPAITDQSTDSASGSDQRNRIKLIFLDFDGVLNSYRTVFAAPEGENGWMPPHLDAVAVGLIRRLCELTGAKICISSSWRKHFNVDQLKEILAKKGWPDAPIIGTTLVRFSERFRGNEIEEFMYDLKREGVEIEAYVAIDDMPQFRDGQHVVMTSDVNGFSLKNFRDALKILDPKNKTLTQLEFHVNRHASTGHSTY